MNNIKTHELEGLQTLSEDEQKLVRGGHDAKGDYKYDDKSYSPGSTIKQADGIYKCQNGSWVKQS